MKRRQFLIMSAAGAMLPLAGTSRLAGADSSSTGTRLILGYAPGGGADMIARLVVDTMRPEYPAGLVVENRPGASGRIGAEFVKTAEPNGSVLLVTPDFAMTVYPHSHRKLNYDPFKDFVPVAPMAVAGTALCAGPAVPAAVKNPTDYIEWCRSNPKMASFGSPGQGSSFHFTGLMLGRAKGVELTHVGYKGSGPALQDLAGGHVPVTIGALGAALPLLKAGRIRLLGTFGSVRDPFAPEAPTMVESGFKDVVVNAWVGVFAPAKTPPGVVERHMRAINRATSSSTLKARLAEQAMSPMTLTSAEFGAMVRNDSQRWAPVVKASGFTAEE